MPLTIYDHGSGTSTAIWRRRRRRELNTNDYSRVKHARKKEKKKPKEKNKGSFTRRRTTRITDEPNTRDWGNDGENNVVGFSRDVMRMFVFGQ